MCVFAVHLALTLRSAPFNVCVCLRVSSLPRSVYEPHAESLVTMETKFGEGPNTDASIPSPQSEAVANELQELSLQPAPNLLPVRERKNGRWQFLHLNHIKLLPLLQRHVW